MTKTFQQAKAEGYEFTGLAIKSLSDLEKHEARYKADGYITLIVRERDIYGLMVKKA